MKTISRFTFCGLLVLGVFASQGAHAQVGNDNVTGPSGIFNGDITTAGSYDPYTGCIMRSIPELTVAAGVGAQPLAFSRIYNSRYASYSAELFGSAGTWSHSYNWVIEPSPELVWHQVRQPGAYVPTSYAVHFPDGRIETFVYSASDIYYRTSPGVGDRLIRLDVNTSLVYLVLTDGSKVEFKATESFYHDVPNGDWYTSYGYVAQAIIDPYGLRTTLTYNADGTLQKVTEPAGRYIQFFYTTFGGQQVFDHITGSDGRSVQYYYVQTSFPVFGNLVCLDHVVYYGDANWTARYTYQAANVGIAVPLVRTCDDPMYPGPMKRIGYVYRTTNNPDGTQPVYGQITSENYFDGTNVGAALTTLTVNNGTTRTETRADGKTRTFTYSSAKLTSCTDFKGVSASQGRDSNSYINSVTDRNGHTTNLTLNALTGGVLTTTFPSTPGDTPPGTPRGVVTYTYGWATCPDPNNRDANNPYYLYSITDEGGHGTTFTRDSSKRVSRIDYPDGGYETFAYNSFNQVLNHQMKTGGTEAFSYDGRGLKQTYRDPYHATGNATASYRYDTLDRLSDVTDALGSALGDPAHTTSYSYNARGQQTVLTHPTDPNDGQRHTVINAYNPDGTLSSVTDELNHVTSCTYDDYRRLLTKVTPQRFTGDNTARTTYTYYDATGTGNDYTHADANVTHTTRPSGKKITATYDENYRKTSVTVGDGTSDAAKTSYGYDNVGNVTSVVSPNEQPGQQYAGKSTITAYDERNRPYSITDALNDPPTTIQFDAAGRKLKITRPNGQVTTFDSYDAMNRLLQQTVKQTPDPDAVTKYTYYPSGLLNTMKDPKLSSGSYNYSYAYDQIGRKTSLTYPPDSGSVQRSESWHYDIAGRNDTFTNRAGNIQTFTYDALNRPTLFVWNDGGVTPPVSFGYDAASRTTSIGNWNAGITRVYFNDNLLNTETTTYVDAVPHTVTYTYDADGNRLTLQYPASAYSFTYNYTNRNQLKTIVNNAGGGTVITYAYDPDGNLTSRTPNNSTSSTYTYDAIDRSLSISHAFAGSNTRTLAYGYDSVGNKKWTKRDGGNGDVFGYDAADQATSVLLNVANPNTVGPGPQTIVYDPNGNRTSFAPYGPTDTYTTNNLNQYTARNSTSAVYDYNGNMTTGVDGSTYTYDAQNRVLSANKGGTTEQFYYDGLNRQGSRTPIANGVTIALQSYANNLYVTAQNSTTPLIANHSSIGSTEQYQVVDQGNGYAALRSVANGLYVCADNAGASPLIANRTAVGNWEQFKLITTGGGKFALIARANGMYACADNAGNTALIANRTAIGTWEQFTMVFVSSGSPTVNNVYDGWDLIAEYSSGSSIASNAYLHGAGGLVKNLTTNNYYYQDASGSTSHLANSVGTLLEWYRYDLQGAPVFYNSSNAQISGSNYGVRHLFTGQQWYSDIGLYDLRNRVYSPDIGRLLQPDPIGFDGDATNLYRYCSNNPLVNSDPLGKFAYKSVEGSGDGTTRVILIPIRYAPGVPWETQEFINTSIGQAWSNDQVYVMAYTATPTSDPPGAVNNLSIESGSPNFYPFFGDYPYSRLPNAGSLSISSFNDTSDEAASAAAEAGGWFMGTRQTPDQPGVMQEIWPTMDLSTPLPPNAADVFGAGIGSTSGLVWNGGPGATALDPNAGFYGMPVTGAGPYMGGNMNSNNPGYVAPGVGPQGNPADSAVGGPPLPPQKYK
jgi:RHS repeat-associated protein